MFGSGNYAKTVKKNEIMRAYFLFLWMFLVISCQAKDISNNVSEVCPTIQAFVDNSVNLGSIDTRIYEMPQIENSNVDSLQAAIWKSPDLLNNDWSNWSGLNGGTSLIQSPTPDDEVNVKIGFFDYTYFITRFSTAYSFLEHPVAPGKRYEYTVRARVQDDIISSYGIFEHSWFSRISGYKSSTGSTNWPIPNYSYVINELTSVINEDFIRLEIGCSYNVLGNTKANYSYGEFDWARLKQVIYVPKLEIEEKNIYLTPDQINSSSITIGLHLNDLSFADTPTSWSIDWGDGTIQSYPVLNAFYEHTYDITTGIGQTWTVTLYGSNLAGSSDDSINISLIPEPATITVDADGSADFDNIQAAIDAAFYRDTIIVADGMYCGQGNRDIDFHGKAITLKSENGPNNCIIDCNGTLDDPHRGIYFHTEEDANSVLDGFIIKNGYTCNGMGNEGGGIRCDNSSPTIINCVISESFADGNGGGLYCKDSSPFIQNCMFIENSADKGGAIYSYQEVLENSFLKIENCALSKNTANISGGGLYCNRVSLILKNCSFSQNSADSGGGLFSSDCDAVIGNCTFCLNSAEQDGGAVFASEYESEYNITLTNSTFTQNSASSGGAISLSSLCAALTNCILWNNAASYGNEIYLDRGSMIEVSYSDIEGGWEAVYTGGRLESIWGAGNIDLDPCFAGPYNGDYHLLSASPCISAGDPNHIVEPNETDIDGLSRITGGRIDMGAYEFNHQLGNFDLDGDVDFIDFTILAGAWMSNDAPTANWDARCDLDCSGRIDTGDLLNFVENWLKGAAE